jgi:hypothetical protein
VRRLEGPEPDALVTVAYLGVEHATRPLVDAAVARGRAGRGSISSRGPVVILQFRWPNSSTNLDLVQ